MNFRDGLTAAEARPRAAARRRAKAIMASEWNLLNYGFFVGLETF